MKTIAFIATREPTYSRVSIVHDALHESFEVVDFTSSHPQYAVRMLSVVSQLLMAWITGRLSRFELVFVGFFAQPIFPLVRCLYSGRIISDAYFSLYDTLVHDKRRAEAQSVVGRLCHWLDKTMLRRSELCLTDTQAHAAYFRSEFELPNAQIERLWISADIAPLDRSAVPAIMPTSRDASENTSEPFTLMFWGGFIPLQGVETIVFAAKLLAQHNVHFKIFGAGQTLEECEQLICERGLRNIELLGWKSQLELRAEAARAHVALGIFGTTDKAARVIPNKVYEALAMGLPLVTRESPAIDELLTDGADVFTVPPGDPQALADKLLFLRENYSLAGAVAQAGQRVFSQIASPECVAQQLREYIEQIGKAESPAGRGRQQAFTRGTSLQQGEC